MIRVLCTFFCIIVFVPSVRSQQVPSDRYFESGYWKNQALTEILPRWTQYGRDPVHGAFYSNLDVNWKPEANGLKYPSMIARNLFSYSVAYLLSGQDEYLAIARDTRDYLLAHAWDTNHGGWYDALDATGNPAQTGKSTFVQGYVITGLTLYYFVTHDAEVLRYIDQSNNLLEKNTWDPVAGGYFDFMDQDWTPRGKTKSIGTQVAPVSGYLLYLYLATRNPKYLDQMERIMDCLLKHMLDTRTGWALETFDERWNYQPGRQKEEEVNVGHNLEVAWTLLRLFRLNQRMDYLHAGEKLADSVHRYGFNRESGFWYGAIGNRDPAEHTTYGHWWIQAYGNMFNLFLNQLDPRPEYLEAFRRGASCWERFYVDQQRGDTYLTVMESGLVRDDRKANQYKASYHSMEHCLLNDLYLACWTSPKNFTLHFKITSSRKGDRLHPLPIEIPEPPVKSVSINGKAVHSSFTGGIRLPAMKEAKVEVVFRGN